MSEIINLERPQITQPIYEIGYIHPDNMAIMNAISRAKPLGFWELWDYRKRLRSLREKLKKAGYYEVVTMYEATKGDFDTAMRVRARVLTEIETHGDSQERQIELREVSKRAKRLINKGASLAQKRRAFAKDVRRLKTLEHRLQQHQHIQARQKAEYDSRRVLEKEAHYFHDVVIETLTQLGHCYRYSRKGKEHVHRVSIERIHSTADSHYMKIRTVRKGLFGMVQVTPRHVNPIDLITEKTLAALSISCHVQVEGFATRKNGAWYRVNRFSSTDGLPEHVAYSDLIKLYPTNQITNIPIPIGVSVGSRVEFLNASDYPHFLIAGTTGSGKSNMSLNIISTIIARQNPNDVRLILVDMKEGSEFAYFQDANIPHLLKVVTSPAELANTLASLEKIRAERGAQFAKVYASNIDQYNERVSESQKIPRIFVLIDEFGAIYLNNAFDSENENKRIATMCRNLVRQLLAKARSAGIHVIIGTQTPYAEILPGPDKANISIKLCGRMPTVASSRVVLDTRDAADLPPDVHGRMIASTYGNLIQIQTPLVTFADVEAACETARAWDAPRPLLLPETTHAQNQFTQHDLIELALKSYGGDLVAHRMWKDGIKDEGVITYRALRQMIEKIVIAKTIEHNGQRFRLEGLRGGGNRLVIFNSFTDLQPLNSVKDM
jgi:hypothetical protein